MQRRRRNHDFRLLTPRGAVVIVAMIALLLVAMIGVSLLKLALAQQRQVRREQVRLQAEWLAEAGLERGAAQLARDPEYGGEEWEIAAEELDGRRAGLVRIAVERSEARPDDVALKVIATFPRDTEQRAQVTRRANIHPAGSQAPPANEDQ